MRTGHRFFTWLLAIAASGTLLASTEVGHPPPADYAWQLAVAPRQGNWPRWNLPIPAYDGRLWAFQDERWVWSSSDGIDWERAKSNAAWGERYLSAVAYFRGKLWVLGGRVGPAISTDYRNDVWVSENGTNWELRVPKAPWSPRAGHTAIVFDNKLWIFGGTASAATDDVWYTEDGAHWTLAAPSVGWSHVFHRTVFVFRDRLWVVGFHRGDDVWHSADGVRWTRATQSAGWGAEHFKSARVFDGRIWASGGANDRGTFHNDVWSSADGVAWERVSRRAPWSPRLTNYSVVFHNRLWVYGGKNGADDVWYLAPAE